jgi:ribosomal protein S12 methylthiotransferase accessory factor YcaO
VPNLTSLTDEIRRRGLELAPGTLIFQEHPGRIVAVCRDPALRIEVDFEPGEVDGLVGGLRDHGCLEEAAPPSRLRRGRGVPVTEVAAAAKRTTRTLLGLGEALHIPAEVPGPERALASWRFAASLSPAVAAAAASVARGDAQLVDFRISDALAEAIERLPPPAGEVSVLTGRLESWQPVPLTARVGSLRPAQTLNVTQRGRIHIAAAQALPSPGGLGEESMFGSGIAHRREDAAVAAVAEAYERHCAGVVPAGDIFAARGSDLPGFIAPEEFVSYRDSHLRREPNLVPFSPTEQRLWVQVKRRDGSTVSVLADLVFFPFGRPGIARHTYSNSSGMAAHETFPLAEEAAWRELVERDAFMRHWLGRKPGRHLEIPSGDGTVEHFTAMIEAAGWSLRCVQLGESPRLPIVAAIATHEGKLVVGASTASPHLAVAKACSEAWAGVCLPRGEEEVPAVDAVRTPSDHRRLYRWGAHLDEAAFLWDCEEEVSIGELGDPPPMPAEAVVYRWPAHVSAPYRVVRVMCPTMIPITFGVGCEPLGRSDAAALVSATGRSLDTPLFPHPFP